MIGKNSPRQAAELRRFTHNAMGTYFEIIIAGEKPAYARQAADAVFALLDEIEGEISRFLQQSDVTRINALLPGESTRLGLHTLSCLKMAFDWWRETGKAFDVTVGPLVNYWRNVQDRDREPDPEQLKAIRKHVGMEKLEVDEEEMSVSVKTQGVAVDFGGIGKGYALDRMAELLGDWDVEKALIHAGESTALALDSPHGGQGWVVTAGGSPTTSPRKLLLRNQAVSGSGEFVKGPHIIDPRTGWPIHDHRGAWVLAPTAASADALSTAFIVMTPAEVEKYCMTHDDVAWLLIPRGKEDKLIEGGKWPWEDTTKQ